MTRTLFLLTLLFSFGISSGCRMCGSSLDDCIPAFLDREDDYRGCDPYYRAGSITHRQGGSGCCGETNILTVADRADNAGHFGVTTPITEALREGGRSISLPPNDLKPNAPDFRMPTIEELKKGPRPSSTISLPQEAPVRPETRRPGRNYESTPTTPPPAMPGTENIETLPFTGQPLSEEPRITVEELRRLEEPDITEIKILNIEDSVDTASETIPWK